MVQIAGIQKLTLLDYPGLTACTIFMNGCNFRCPYCHNSSLVINSEFNEILNEDEILEFLKTRKGRLDGVCITGGEPLLQKDLIPFIKKIKDIGYKVKLDTNGYLTGKLKEILDLNLVDYVAMDIKSSITNYEKSIGLKMINKENIQSSIDLIKNSNLENYEFRTTVVKELHSLDDFKEIGEMLLGSKQYFLQQFKWNEFNIVNTGYSSYSKEELEKFRDYLIKNCNLNTFIRGVD